MTAMLGAVGQLDGGRSSRRIADVIFRVRELGIVANTAAQDGFCAQERSLGQALAELRPGSDVGTAGSQSA